MEVVECQFLGGRKYRSMLSYVRIFHGSEARDTQKIVKIHHAQLQQNDRIHGGRLGEQGHKITRAIMLLWLKLNFKCND